MKNAFLFYWRPFAYISGQFFYRKNGAPMPNNPLVTLFSSCLLCLLALPAGATDKDRLPDKLELSEWEVPWGGRPRDPYVAPNGQVWFCGQDGNYIGRFDPETETFERFEVDKGTHPHNLIVDSDGFIWYAGNRNAMIGKLDPDSGDITRFPMPEAIDDPHTLVFDKQGNIWFTAQHSNVIGHLNTRSGKVRHVKVDTPRARPYGIKVDQHNRPWVVLLGTNKLATVDPADFSLKEITLPRESTRPRRIEITRDGTVWFVDYRSGYLGRYQPEQQVFDDWLMPGEEASQPYGTALDAQGRIWIALTGMYPNRIVGFDSRKEKLVSASSVPSGGAIRHMYYHPDEDVFWFGVDSGYLVRARYQDRSGPQ